MKYVAHEYQAYTTKYIEDHEAAAIYLGMGLGKTVSTLTAINNLLYDSFEVGKVLVIAPLRVARDTWPAEVKKWDHLKNLRVISLIGSPARREKALEQPGDIYVINRENVPWLVNHYGRRWPFDMVVIDELSSFKNPSSKRFKALKSVRKFITRMVGLTGTPAPNSLLDIWAPYRLLDDGQRLGKYITHYRSRFFIPDKRNGMQVYSWKLKEGAEAEIYELVADMTVSMKTTDYLDLPGLTVSMRPVELSSKDRKTYEKLKTDLITSVAGNTIEAASAGVLVGKLQQLASGRIYVDDDKNICPVHDKKITALTEIVEEAEGQSVLIAYWFAHELDALRQTFPDGVALSTSEDMQAWNNGELAVAFIHPASAGHGLNLQTGGHILVWLTTPWSLELVEQTNARLFRQGQTNPVSVIHLIATGTVDEDIQKALTLKSFTQTGLMDAVSAQLRA